MKFTIPSITITLPTVNFPTTTTTKATIKQKLHTLTALRTPKLPNLPLGHSLAILNDTLQDTILDKHSAHVNQARLHRLSNTYNVSELQQQLQFSY